MSRTTPRSSGGDRGGGFFRDDRFGGAIPSSLLPCLRHGHPTDFYAPPDQESVILARHGLVYSGGQMSMDITTAVKLAKSYIAGHPDFAQISSRRLEEAEIDDVTGDWLVTISFFSGEPKRLCMQVRVGKSAGEILSCTRHNPAA